MLNAFVPCIDGDSIYKPIPYLLNDLDSSFKPNLSLLIGNNANEGDLFAFGYAGGLTVDQSSYDAITSTFFPSSSPQEKQALLSMYTADAQNNGYWHALSDIIGQGAFMCPTSLVADSIANFTQQNGVGNVYRYRFTHRTENIEVFPFSVLNVTHFCEVPYVFFYGPVLNFSFTPEEWTLAGQIVTYWTNFANFGDPNGNQKEFEGRSSSSSSSSISLPTWPVYVPGTSEKTILVLDLETSLTNDAYLEEVLPVWDHFYSLPGAAF